MQLLGELLVKYGMINKQQLKEALEVQQREKKRVGEILIELGYLQLKDLAWVLSEQADVPFVELKPEMLDTELIMRFPERLLVDNNILPLYQTEDAVYLVVGDPSNRGPLEDLKAWTPKRLSISGADPQSIRDLLAGFLAQQKRPGAAIGHRGAEIRLADPRAIIEFIDEQGKRRTETGKAEIVIHMDFKQEGTDE